MVEGRRGWWRGGEDGGGHERVLEVGEGGGGEERVVEEEGSGGEERVVEGCEGEKVVEGRRYYLRIFLLE